MKKFLRVGIPGNGFKCSTSKPYVATSLSYFDFLKTLVIGIFPLALAACSKSFSPSSLSQKSSELGTSPPPSSPTSTYVENYLGCYTDASSRALSTPLIAASATVESCIAAARSAGLALAGLEYGGQCWGGNALGYALAAENKCNMPCTSNPSETCGGSWTNSIYAVSSTATSLSGVTIPPASRIVDGSGTAWTVMNGKSYENGSADGGANITFLLYYDGAIYANTTSYGWRSHASGSWATFSGDPRVPSDSGACGDEPPPPQAVAAGFTTCATNNDWTAATGTSWVPTRFAFSGPVSTVSNWLECTANGSQTNANLPWHTMGGGYIWNGVTSVLNPAPPCAGTVVATDPVLGGQALHMYYDDDAWPLAYDSTDTHGISEVGMQSSVNTWYPGPGRPPGGPATLSYPFGFYVEWYARLDTVSGGSDNGPWTFSTNANWYTYSYNFELYNWNYISLDDGGADGMKFPVTEYISWPGTAGSWTNGRHCSNPLNGGSDCPVPTSFVGQAQPLLNYHKFGLPVARSVAAFLIETFWFAAKMVGVHFCPLKQGTFNFHELLWRPFPEVLRGVPLKAFGRRFLSVR